MPKRRPRSAAHEHLGREAVPVGGDGADVIAEREAVGGNGRDAVAGAVNVGKGAAADLGDPVGVAAVVRPTAGPSSGCLWVAVLLGCATSRPKTKDVIARNLYVKVYLEPYGKSARERLQALVAEAKAGNPFAPVTVVPPNTYAGIGLRRVLAGDGGLLNVGFMALARLAEQLGAPTMASQRRRPLSAASEMAVIRTVAMEMVGKEPLGSVAGHSSLHQSLQEAFKELVRLTEGDLDTARGRGSAAAGHRRVVPPIPGADRRVLRARRRGLGCGGGGALGARATGAAGRGRAGILPPDTAIAG